MRRYGTILLAALVWTVAIGVASSFAGEQADWGNLLCVGTARDGGMLVIENDRGIHAVVVDPYGEVRTNARKRTTLGIVKPGDHIDLAWSTWAGMQIVDLVVIAPLQFEKRTTVR